MVGRVWPRHGCGGRPLNSVVMRDETQPGCALPFMVGVGPSAFVGQQSGAVSASRPSWWLAEMPVSVRPSATRGAKQ